MERDLFIRRMFTNTPLLWELLSFVAVYRPALCYCSVLLRALTATLIHQWKSMGEQSKDDDSQNYKMLMDTTIRVIDLMALGQLLPPPLSSIRDVISNLKCFEVIYCLEFSFFICSNVCVFRLLPFWGTASGVILRIIFHLQHFSLVIQTESIGGIRFYLGLQKFTLILWE